MMLNEKATGLRAWFRSGEPWIWMNAAAVGISIAAVVGVLLLIAIRGFAHFWPASVALIDYEDSLGRQQTALGEIADTERLPVGQYLESTGANPDALPEGTLQVERWLIKTGNRRVAPPDFRWVVSHKVADVSYPADVVVLERVEWGNAYGYLRAVHEDGTLVAEGPAAWQALRERLERVQTLRDEIETLEGGRLQSINYQLEQLRLERRA
ncbi:MAG: phosphate ABC transporter, permease protein PstA, partial [Gammaproteobacteria bacterium]|nr:phosphate ABC transporter, permease protein PstA [Gammaproteobacteria bacterium]